MRESMEIYPRTAAERAMKLQEVLLRVTSHIGEDQVVAGGGVDRHQRAADASLAEAAGRARAQGITGPTARGTEPAIHRAGNSRPVRRFSARQLGVAAMVMGESGHAWLG